MNTGGVLKVALATPLMQLFDYLLPADGLPADGSADSGRAIAQRGQRVLVPFGRGRRVGIVCALSDESEVPPDKLRRALSIIDAEPLFDESLMALLEWAASYYHHPLGEVFSAALPAALRAGRAAATGGDTCWRLTTKASTEDTTALAKRAKVQAAILRSLRETEAGATAAELETSGSTWRRAVAALEDKGLVERYTREREVPKISLPTATAPTLTDEQRTAVDAITAATGFTAFLLEGITGSGKTEVYLRCIEQQLETSRQTLVIVPEIGLTPQLVARFRSRLQTPVTVMHSGLNDTERLQAWCDAREGKAGVVIGTRSAVFVPLARPGLIVVDEEHDASLKQQEGFRYSARDLAVWRARQLDIPAILGSATPSLESIDNVEAKRYAHLLLPRRPGAARPPDIRLIDLRHQPARDGLTEPLRDAIARHLDANGQVLVYLNRRGFAPGLLCTACGELVECKRCDSRMVLHRQRERIVCHHCGAERPLPTACDACGEPELVAVGQGTERVEAALEALYPEHALVRIDRDTTRRRGEIERRLELVRSGAIGAVRECHAWVGGDRGMPAMPTEFPDVPPHLDWDLWLGPTADRPYSPAYCPYNWRFWWDFGTGETGNWGCHILDIPYWALDLKHAVKVAGSGPPVDPQRTPKSLQTRIEFPKRGALPPVTLNWYHTKSGPPILEEHGLPHHGSGVLFVGSEGMLLCEFGKRKLYPEKKFEGFEPPPKTIPDSPGFHKEWITACKGGQPATCNFDYSGPMAETVLLGNLAYRIGEEFTWDAANIKSPDCDAVEPHINPTYRNGWPL